MDTSGEAGVHFNSHFKSSICPPKTAVEGNRVLNRCNFDYSFTTTLTVYNCIAPKQLQRLLKVVVTSKLSTIFIVGIIIILCARWYFLRYDKRYFQDFISNDINTSDFRVLDYFSNTVSLRMPLKMSLWLHNAHLLAVNLWEDNVIHTSFGTLYVDLYFRAALFSFSLFPFPAWSYYQNSHSSRLNCVLKQLQLPAEDLDVVTDVDKHGYSCSYLLLESKSGHKCFNNWEAK